MASSLFVNTVHICFESVLAMDNAGTVALFESLVATGLKGFMGCPAVIHEAALLEFFQNGSFRDGLVVSTMNGMTVEISEHLFVETFELSVEVSTSGKKREMTMEFRLLCHILAKTIFVKDGSFDAITQEKFLMLVAITCGVKINWNRLLFNTLKDMVTLGIRQAKGYAIQISLLLDNVPNMELRESSEFPSSKILTKKTVHRYISLNDKVGVEEVADVPRVKRTPVTKAVFKKRPAVTTAAEPVEAVPLQIIEPTAAAPTEQPPSAPKCKIQKRKRRLVLGDDDEIVEQPAAEIASETTMGEPEQPPSAPKCKIQKRKRRLVLGDDDEIVEQPAAEIASETTMGEPGVEVAEETVVEGIAEPVSEPTVVRVDAQLANLWRVGFDQLYQALNCGNYCTELRHGS
ncbi:patatin-like protein 2 [Dorcoceras hygrometricum]|uniref:Patatin-like protein 2 n=1 Tax=Dorcoceras hygrometricum TaxID=472368 RepID=A0A2Z7AH79_9LAMI|nr:patatin-like protein 2 [Dorcoceras hygrometricum]